MSCDAILQRIFSDVCEVQADETHKDVKDKAVEITQKRQRKTKY